MINKDLTPVELIRLIRESFNGSKTVYTSGSCFQFYLILKGVFPDAEPYYDDLQYHVYTKINDKFYDIYGELVNQTTINILQPLKNLAGTYKDAPSWLWSLENYILKN